MQHSLPPATEIDRMVTELRNRLDGNSNTAFDNLNDVQLLAAVMDRMMLLAESLVMSNLTYPT